MHSVNVAVITEQRRSLFCPFLRPEESRSILHLQVLEVQVSLVLVGGLVSIMTVGDDGVQQFLEDLIGLLVTSNAANGHDEGVTCGQRGKKRGVCCQMEEPTENCDDSVR